MELYTLGLVLKSPDLSSDSPVLSNWVKAGRNFHLSPLGCGHENAGAET